MRTWSCIVLFAVALGANGQTMKKYTYTGMNGKEHDIEVYLPKNHKSSAKVPCFIHFHGGGWSGGSLSSGRPFCKYFASRGIVALTANYSMHPKINGRPPKLPAGESRKRICVIDGKTVIRWVKTHAQELGIAPNKIVAAGGSAGGHIALLSMMNDAFNNPRDPKNITTDVQAFVLMCPAFVLPERDRTADVNVFKNLNKKLPPMLFLVGETDGWRKACSILTAKLSRNGENFECWMGPKSGHMFFRGKSWKNRCLIKIDAFLVKNGFLKGTSPLEPEQGVKLVKLH